jgi:hypothetical protein
MTGIWGSQSLGDRQLDSAVVAASTFARVWRPKNAGQAGSLGSGAAGPPYLCWSVTKKPLQQTGFMHENGWVGRIKAGKSNSGALIV